MENILAGYDCVMLHMWIWIIKATDYMTALPVHPFISYRKQKANASCILRVKVFRAVGLKLVPSHVYDPQFREL